MIEVIVFFSHKNKVLLIEFRKRHFKFMVLVWSVIICSLIIDINLPSIIGNIIEKKYEKKKCLNETWLSKMRLDMITILICYMFKRACPKILVDFYTSQNQLKNYLYISCFNDLKTQTIFSVKNKRMKMLMAFQRGTRCWYG